MGNTAIKTVEKIKKQINPQLNDVQDREIDCQENKEYDYEDLLQSNSVPYNQIFKLRIKHKQIQTNLYSSCLSIGNFVRLCKNLRSLSITLNYYKLIDKQFSSMMKDFSGFKYIIRLEINLCYSKLGEKALKELWNQVSKIQTLQYLVLDLTKNRIDNKITQDFISSVIQLKTIKWLSLNLNENYLTNDGLNLLLQLYQSYQDINYIQLYLDYNLVTWKGIFDFCKELSKFKKLYQLDFSARYIIDSYPNGTITIQKFMRKSKRLIKIQLFDE
ncbi:hypothetical protein ABPG74_005295 [Tetrahymena malaccensis]